MIKAIELIVVVTLMVFSFFIGVKYSENVKSHAGWLFETKEEEVDLPDLTNENGGEESTVYDSGDSLETGDQMPETTEGMAAPMDNSGADVPEQNPVAAPAAPVKANKPAIKKQ